MAYASIKPIYYRVGQGDSRTHTVSPGLGKNQMRSGPVSLRGLGDAVVYSDDASVAGKMSNLICMNTWRLSNPGKPYTPLEQLHICLPKLTADRDSVQNGTAKLATFVAEAAAVNEKMRAALVASPDLYPIPNQTLAGLAKLAATAPVVSTTSTNQTVASSNQSLIASNQASVAPVAATGSNLTYIALGVFALVGVGIAALAIRGR